MKGREKVNYGISIVAIVLSLLAITRVYPRTTILGFDYIGAIVGILSLLVTVLIGWNIYTIIDVKQSKQYIDEKLDDYDHEISGGVYQAMGISKYDLELYAEALYMFVMGIKEQNASRKQVYTNNLLDYILRIKDKNVEIRLGKDNKEEFIEILNGSKKGDKKKRRLALEYIKSLQVNEESDE